MLGFLDLEEERRGRVLATVVAGRRGGHSVHHCMLYTVQVHVHVHVTVHTMYLHAFSRNTLHYSDWTLLFSSTPFFALLQEDYYKQFQQYQRLININQKLQEDKLNELKEGLQHKCEIPQPTHPPQPHVSVCEALTVLSV